MANQQSMGQIQTANVVILAHGVALFFFLNILLLHFNLDWFSTL